LNKNYLKLENSFSVLEKVGEEIRQIILILEHLKISSKQSKDYIKTQSLKLCKLAMNKGVKQKELDILNIIHLVKDTLIALPELLKAGNITVAIDLINTCTQELLPGISGLKCTT